VASRVLPVRIHDLDIADIKLCESVLGGVIRGVDFIYKEPGVNRPLTAEDDEKKNQTGAKYRNQINKTANAIKDIIAGLKAEPAESEREKTLYQESWKEIKTDSNLKGFISSKLFSVRQVRKLAIMIIIVFIIAGAFAIYRIMHQVKTGKTIAVFYSPDVKGDTTLKNICDVYTENAHASLNALKNLTIGSRSAMLRYRDNPENLRTIRKDLGIDYLLYGNVRRNRNEIIVWIELTSTRQNMELWSKEYKWDVNLISQNNADVIQAVARSLKIKLTSAEIKQIESEPTRNAEANLNYSIANSISYHAWLSYTMANKYVESTSFFSAIQGYDKVIREESLFAQAYAKRAIARSWGYYTGQLDSTHIEKCLDDINKTLEIDQNLPEAQIALGFYYYYCKREFEKALEHFGLAAKEDPENYQPLFYMAMVYRKMGDWEKSQILLRKVIRLNPQEALYLTNIGISYAYLHNYDSALIFHQKAIDMVPVWSAPYNHKIHALILKNGNPEEAQNVLDTAIKKTGENFKELRILLNIFEKKFEEALHETEKSHASDFMFKGNRYLYMAMINNDLGNPLKAGINYDSALVSFNNDLKNNFGNPALHSFIGIASAGIGNKEKAIDEGEKAVELSENDELRQMDMIINLAQIYTMVGVFDKAVSTIEYLLINPSFFSTKLLKIDPAWSKLTNHPEYKSLISKYSNN
jgi:tetratricopeptide (TPR) repeat protein